MKTRALTILGLAICASSAFAQISIRFDSTGLGRNVDMLFDGSSMTAFAGQLNFTDQTNNKALQTYCVDLENVITGGQNYNVNVQNTLGNPTFERAGSIHRANNTTVASNNAGAALQIAIWAARYGTNLSTNTGSRFKLSNSWYNNHQSIINEAIAMTQNGDANPGNALLYNPTQSNCGQAQIGSVPEPASIIALGVGAVGLLRRRKRAN